MAQARLLMVPRFGSGYGCDRSHLEKFYSEGSNHPLEPESEHRHGSVVLGLPPPGNSDFERMTVIVKNVSVTVHCQTARP